MLDAWEELDMTTVARDTGLPAELLVLLEELSLRYEILDGSLVVNPPPIFDHEDFLMALAVQLRLASPPGIAVLGSGYKYFYDALRGNTRNHTMADITVVSRDRVERAGTVHPPLLVVEVQSPGTQRRDLGEKREIYERTGVRTYLLLHPEHRTLTVLRLVDGAYVETHHVGETGAVRLTEPFEVELDLGQVFRT